MPGEVTEQVDGAARCGAGRACAALAVVAVAGLLPLLPVLVALGFARGLGASAVAAAAGLAAAIGGGKLAALAWGLAWRWEAPASS